MKLHRPYIPLAIRIKVVERQLRKKVGWTDLMFSHARSGFSREGGLLHYLLQKLSASDGVESYQWELHHRPALINRPSGIDTVRGTVVYIPDANDPDYLVYLAKPEHDIETRVRGVGAQRSDLGQRRYNRKVARNRAPKPKRPWRWPKGRKLRSRAINPGWRRKRNYR